MNDLTVNDCYGYEPVRLKSLSMESVANLFEDFINKDITLKELSKAHRIPHQTASWLISKHLLPTRAEETRVILLQSKV